MKNVLRNVIVIAMVSFFTVMVFTACGNSNQDSSNSNQDNSGSSEVAPVEETPVEVTELAVYKTEWSKTIETKTFYSDNTFVEHYKDESSEFVAYKGTFEGNPNADGTLTLCRTYFTTKDKETKEYKMIKYPSPKKFEIIISTDSFEFEKHTYTKIKK